MYRVRTMQVLVPALPYYPPLVPYHAYECHLPPLSRHLYRLFTGLLTSIKTILQVAPFCTEPTQPDLLPSNFILLPYQPVDVRWILVRVELDVWMLLVAPLYHSIPEDPEQ